MQHLTVDQIIDFVSLTKLDKEAAALSAAVNGHVRVCAKCLERVKAFQEIYDVFSLSAPYTSQERYSGKPMLTDVVLEAACEDYDGDR